MKQVTLNSDLFVYEGAAENELFIENEKNLKIYKFVAEEKLLLEALLNPSQRTTILAKSSATFGVELDEATLTAFIEKLSKWGLIAGIEGEQQNAESDFAQQSTQASMTATPEQDRKKNSATADQHSLHLFCPEDILDYFIKWLAPARRLWIFFLLIFIFSIIGFINNWFAVQQDLIAISLKINFLQHIVFSLLTTNLFSQLLKGLIARYYRFATPSLALTLLIGVIPRFILKVKLPESASKEARLWVAASGMLGRLLLFPLGVYLWIAIRGQGTWLSAFGLTLALSSIISFLFVANPLMGSSGYQLISQYFDQPGLRANALFALRSSFTTTPKSVVKHLNQSLAVRLYAWMSVVFTFGLVSLVLLASADWFEKHYGGLGVFAIALLAAYVFVNLYRRVFKVGKNIRLKQKIEFLSQDNVMQAADSQGRKSSLSKRGTRKPFTLRWRKYTVWLILGAILFLPYRYEPGGSAEILPLKKQEIYAQYPGIIEKIFFHGGEQVTRGTPIAMMSSVKQRRDIAVTQALIEEKTHRLALLKSTPSPAELALAEAALETARIRVKYSDEQAKRIRKIFDEDGISYVAYEDALEKLEIAQHELQEQAANLNMVKQQVQPEEIAAVEAELRSLQRDLEYYQELFERTMLRMPFDGVIATMNLKTLENRYLDEGDLFVEVEYAARVQAVITIPESEISLIDVGDQIRLRLLALPNSSIKGRVSMIAPQAKQAEYGNIVDVYSVIENSEQHLKSGMTGYGKIEGTEMLVIEAFTRALVRFFRVEFWSWLP